MSDDLWSAAVHEAGHAVVALYFQIPVGQIEIRDDGSGSTQPLSSDEHLQPFDRVVVCMAGGSAQEHFKCSQTGQAMLSDYVRASNILDDVPEDERKPMMDKAYDVALEIVACNAEEVLRLAKTVFGQRQINATGLQPPLAIKH
jgi:ATP-dependent Zn protease